MKMSVASHSSCNWLGDPPREIISTTLEIETGVHDSRNCLIPLRSRGEYFPLARDYSTKGIINEN